MHDSKGTVGKEAGNAYIFLPSLFSNHKSYENKNQNYVPDHKSLFIENETGTCNSKIICIIYDSYYFFNEEYILIMNNEIW